MKIIRRWALLCLFGVLFALCACGEKPPKEVQAEQQSYKIYYVNKSGTKLGSETVMTDLTEKKELMDFLMEQLQSDSDSNLDNKRAIAEGIPVLSYNIDKNQVTIYFGSEYQGQSKIAEILSRAAIVRTITQISEIENVAFYVNEQPLVDASGQPVGIMKASDFIDDLGGTISEFEKTMITLYFTNAAGDQLISESREVIYKNTSSMEKVIVEELIKGPMTEGLYPVVPSDTKIITINTQDGICYANFDSAFLTGSVNTKEYITIYGLVNSLAELANVNKVQISINGETNKKYREVVSLENAFDRNLDLVVSLEEITQAPTQTETVKETGKGDKKP